VLPNSLSVVRDRFDNSKSNDFAVIAEHETTEWRVVVKSLHAEVSDWHHGHDGTLAFLDMLGVLVEHAALSIHQGVDLGDAASFVSSVHVYDWRVTDTNATRMVE